MLKQLMDLTVTTNVLDSKDKHYDVSDTDAASSPSGDNLVSTVLHR